MFYRYPKPEPTSYSETALTSFTSRHMVSYHRTGRPEMDILGFGIQTALLETSASVLGTFYKRPPPQTMFDSIAEFPEFVVASRIQNNIRPLDSGYIINTSATISISIRMLSTKRY